MDGPFLDWPGTGLTARELRPAVPALRDEHLALKQGPDAELVAIAVRDARGPQRDL